MAQTKEHEIVSIYPFTDAEVDDLMDNAGEAVLYMAMAHKDTHHALLMMPLLLLSGYGMYPKHGYNNSCSNGLPGSEIFWFLSVC